jgi:sugar phosphate isomerase/epimerase
LGTIRRVADFGYEAVQFAGFFGTPAEQLKAVLDEKKLSVPVVHVPIEQLMKQPLEDIITYNKTIGNDLIICPYLPENMRKTKEDVYQVVQCFDDLGEAFAAAGMNFAYHNHDFDFHPFEGSTVFDMIFENTDPELVKIELENWGSARGITAPSRKNFSKIIESYQKSLIIKKSCRGKEGNR